MVAIGMALIFAGYAVSIWGYCLVRGYDVSFGNVFSSKWPGAQVSQNTPGQVLRPGSHKLGQYAPGTSTTTTNPGQETGTA